MPTQKEAKAEITSTPKKVGNSTNIDIFSGSEEAKIKKAEKIAEKAVIETPSAMKMRERIANAEGGEWITYHEALAEKFGKTYSTSILPIKYTFQQGWKTFVLNEHSKGIWAIFNKSIRAKGEKANGNNIFANEDPEKMIQA